jgi:isoleucyl-tRNA synthetase
MPFDKVGAEVDFSAQELAILEYWQKIDAFDELRRRNQGKPKWSFLDGPITANNPMGVHHAWGRTYKDAYQRYHAMLGQELRYQNGFDCQGLWVEVEVEKDLKLRSKRDIEELVPGDPFASIDKFVNLCKDRVDTYAKVQTLQSIRLGYWMDWDRPEDWAKPPDERRSYFTMSEANNYTIWSFLKKAHNRGLVYRGFDAMPWCPRCGVGISQMEMNEGYRNVAHRAVFLRFPLRERPGENLLVWTTTPWTLTSNVGAAVNPELTYLKVRQGEQVYYMGKAAFTAKRKEEEFKNKAEWVEGVPKLKSLEQMFKEKKGGFEILGEVKGEAMVGWAYDGPFDDLPAQHHPFGYPDELADVVERQKWAPAVSAKDAHRVVAWKDVSEAEGTGIVHIAPGCGKEDFGLGKTVGLPPVAPLSEDGVYLPGFGELTGKQAVQPETADYVLAELQKRGLVFATEKYPHRYPHCWRCKTELLYRLVDEWFISMSWRQEIMKICHDIKWIPGDGFDRELDWLKNMGDWMISKKRFWGLALPIWVDEKTGEFEVIGSREELKERAIEGWDKFEGKPPHRPWVDLVKIRNPKTGNRMSRIGDVGNPWLDAGIVPYSTMRYNTDRNYWKQWFPADFITECFPGQFRNWFYALLAMSTMMEQKAPFKVLLGHALVRDEKGEEMHKSLGNAIPFEDAAQKMSADLVRWMFCRHNPVNNINFGYGPAKELRNKFTLKLWNTYSFFCNYARLDNFDPAAPQVPFAERPDIDRWILSDLQLLIRSAHEAFTNYNMMSFCLEAEDFVDSRLSNWYVRRNRRRFWKSEQSSDKQAAYQTLYTVLTTLTRLVSPIMPFLSEVMHRNLSQDLNAPASVHWCEFPKADEAQIDEKLSGDMQALLRLVSLGSAARNTVKIKVRQPLAEMRVQPADDQDRRAVERFGDQICEELNIKQVNLHDAGNGPMLERSVEGNRKNLGPKYGDRLGAILAALAKKNDERDVALSTGKTWTLEVPGEPVVLAPADVSIKYKSPQDWAGVVDRGTQVMVDTRINTALAEGGMAREVIRHVQELRKKAGLEMEDRIVLYLSTDDPALKSAIANHKAYIMSETLTTVWSDQPLPEGCATARVEVDGKPLVIQLSKATVKI